MTNTPDTDRITPYDIRVLTKRLEALELRLDDVQKRNLVARETIINRLDTLEHNQSLL